MLYRCFSTPTTQLPPSPVSLDTRWNGGKQWAAKRWRRWKRGGRPILQRWKRGGRLVEAVEAVEKPDGGSAVERGSFHRLKSHTLMRHFGLVGARQRPEIRREAFSEIK